MARLRICFSLHRPVQCLAVLGLLAICRLLSPLQAVAQPLPCQDCPGARWVTRSETVLDMSTLSGPGLVANELPTAANTCLSSGERRTLWLMFKVFASDTAEAPGGPAGTLQFTIEPEDVWGQPAQPVDAGTDPQGSTDYDFALFDVTSFAYQADACQAIRRTAAVGQPNTVQMACNYSGLPGPTGMLPAGAEYSVDNQRFCRPLAVRSGQIFILAIDNFSLNAARFRLRFHSSGGARVAPFYSGPIAATTAPAPGCEMGLTLHFSRPVPLDSLTAHAPAGTRLVAAAPANLEQAYQTYLLTRPPSADTLTLQARFEAVDRYHRPARLALSTRLLPAPPRPQLVQTGPDLTIENLPADVTPRWYRNDTLISATGGVLQAPQPGRYRVALQRGACAGPLSDVFLHTITAVQTAGEGTFSVYPQPARQSLSVSLGQPIKSIRLLSLNGNVQPVSAHIEGRNASLATGHLPAGLYLLQVEGPSARLTRRIVIQ